MKYLIFIFILLFTINSFAQEVTSPASDDIAVPAIAEPGPVMDIQPVDTPAVPDTQPTVDVKEAPKDAEPFPSAAIPVDDIGVLISKLLIAVREGDWKVAVGFVLMILLWVFRKFIWNSLNTGYMPWISAGVGFIGFLSAGLVAGMPLWDLAWQGITTGLVACGLWSLIGKHLAEFLSKKEK